jgi:hypothetical protein
VGWRCILRWEICVGKHGKKPGIFEGNHLPMYQLGDTGSSMHGICICKHDLGPVQ